PLRDESPAHPSPLLRAAAAGWSGPSRTPAGAVPSLALRDQGGLPLLRPTARLGTAGAAHDPQGRLGSHRTRLVGPGGRPRPLPAALACPAGASSQPVRSPAGSGDRARRVARAAPESKAGALRGGARTPGRGVAGGHPGGGAPAAHRYLTATGRRRGARDAPHH